MLRVSVVGPGKVGRALFRAFEAAGHAMRALAGRPPWDDATLDALRTSDVIVLAVPDGALSSVAAVLAGARCVDTAASVLHTAGALGPSVLVALEGSAALGTFHPLQTFASRDEAPPLDGVPFAIDGDARAIAAAADLARSLGGVPLVVPEDERALYHAAAVLACGHAALLANVAAGALAQSAHIPTDEALRRLAPILRQTVANLEGLGMPAALTGPLARGDAATVGRHVNVLDIFSPEAASVYRALASTYSTIVKTP